MMCICVHASVYGFQINVEQNTKHSISGACWKEKTLHEKYRLIGKQALKCPPYVDMNRMRVNNNPSVKKSGKFEISTGAWHVLACAYTYVPRHVALTCSSVVAR